jgi:hypothetical protein
MLRARALQLAARGSRAAISWYCAAREHKICVKQFPPPGRAYVCVTTFSVTTCVRYRNPCLLSLDSLSHFDLLFFLIGIVWGGGIQLGPLGTAATNTPIVPARVIMIVEKLVE